MIATVRRLYKWWTGRFERRYREAQIYYDQQTKEALIAERIELEVKREKSSRRWELMLGLVLTIIFSEDLKRLLAIILAPLTGVSRNELQESVLMSLVVALLIMFLLLAIVLYNFSYSLLLRRYLILKQYLEENPIEQQE
ncbi:TPA: hypothetical protein TXZ04_001848 [Streptococcus suis]|nr:hypothetical protein [Streptococcus suis]MDW8743844.1 hypothetical protein [Streptococcus suis]HEL1638534.1 hypothetical protein [Streptococcus suis]HEL1829191.1 hypothetical protein [Streptococcus suis]HEL1998502.1 hypothetical protein [Streptococcus suis]